MPHEVFMLSGLVLAIWLVIIVLRVPVFAAFFSLLVGYLLSSEVSTEAFDFISGILNIPEFRYVQLGLLVAPLLLTILFLKGRASKSKLTLELIPGLFTALATVLLVYPLVPFMQTIVEIATYDQVDRYRTIVLIAAAVSGLLSAWITFPKGHTEKHGKKH